MLNDYVFIERPKVNYLDLTCSSNLAAIADLAFDRAYMCTKKPRT